MSWQAMERELLGVLAEFEGEFEPLHVEQIRVFVNVGEPALALEWICAVLTEKRTPLSVSTYTTIVDLAQGLDIDPDCWHELIPS